MRKTAVLILAGILMTALQVSAQAPAASSDQPKASAAPKTSAGAKTGTTATHSTYDRTLLRPSLLKAKAPETYQVKFVTTRGEFTVTVTRSWAPLGADRFYNLVKHHFYDNATVFRVVPNFVAQFGLSAYPPVSAAWSKANITDDPVTQSNKTGYVTFATAGPNTRTTQLFINLKDNARLDGMGFAPFAVVDGNGMNVVEMFYDQYDSTGISQELIEKQGKAYLDKSFPKLDSIKSVTLVGAAATAATTPAKPAASTKSTAPAAAKPQ
jgi:peptidyl-prolyl cis-trans isomerase A (cyclophilin A)